MLAKSTSRDFQFDNYNTRMCAFDGCRVALAYTNPNKHQVLNDRRYCSLECLKKQYQGLSYDGAVHLVHQTFGPDHPVTREIREMRRELSMFREHCDFEKRKVDGKIKEEKNHLRLCHLSEKCL